MTVDKDLVVSIAYTLKDDAGAILDSSEGRDDLAYLHGHDNIVTGLEEALEGKSVGNTVTASVPPREGVRDPRRGTCVPGVPGQATGRRD